ncbi:hypothetical protein KQX54_018341 [Cotesia glomerata]|uniref:Uncharacterized protein n=1 Tax=Cotesia glomerata TaxID=32391 RepID=A0AAV7IEQ3_COTGL|nr:hypothetical protein KQX54_018341 [Cotesia glomerata]
MDNGWSVYFDPKIFNPRFYSILFKVVCYRDEDLIDTGRCRRTKLCKVRRRVHRFISFLCFKSLQRMEHLLWFFAAHALLLSLRFPIAFNGSQMKRKRWTDSGTGTGCRRIKLFPREMRKRLKPPQEVEK